MVLTPGEDALLVVAVLHHDHAGADGVFPRVRIGLVDMHVADEMHRPRWRRLHVNARMLEPLDARAHERAVIVEQGGLIERALLLRH